MDVLLAEGSLPWKAIPTLPLPDQTVSMVCRGQVAGRILRPVRDESVTVTDIVDGDAVVRKNREANSRILEKYNENNSRILEKYDSYIDYSDVD